MEKLLVGKTAIVTGAARGIGKAVALKFAREGADVVMLDILEKELKESKAEVEAFGTKVEAIAADLTVEGLVMDTVDTVVRKFGTVDILMNCAGISQEMPLNEMSMETFDKIMEVNLRSVVLMIKAVLPIMIQNKCGNICSIASGAALRGLPGSSAYSASKAALLCLSQALGDEQRPNGIRVNVICPGPVDTEMFQKSAAREFILKAGGDLFSPDTVANGALFLVSELSQGVSSQVLTMRGFNRW